MGNALGLVNIAAYAGYDESHMIRVANEITEYFKSCCTSGEEVLGLKSTSTKHHKYK
jgi:hypothetical protein